MNNYASIVLDYTTVTASMQEKNAKKLIFMQ